MIRRPEVVNDSWETPKELFDELNKEFKFADFDPCPLDYTVDGLTLDWPDRTFVNPPYSRLRSTRKYGKGWMEKADEEVKKGKLVVCLIPARTDTVWFHEYVVIPKHEVRFLRKRLRFSGSTQNAPFPSLVVIMRPTTELNFLDAPS